MLMLTGDAKSECMPAFDDPFVFETILLTHMSPIITNILTPFSRAPLRRLPARSHIKLPSLSVSSRTAARSLSRIIPSHSLPFFPFRTTIK